MPSRKTLGERVAVLETESAHAKEIAESINAKLDGIASTLEKHTTELARYRGFAGAVLLIGSAITAGWAFLKSLLPYLAAHFR